MLLNLVYMLYAPKAAEQCDRQTRVTVRMPPGKLPVNSLTDTQGVFLFLHGYLEHKNTGFKLSLRWSGNSWEFELA